MSKRYTKRQMNIDIEAVKVELEAATLERAEIQLSDECGEKVDMWRWNHLHNLIDYELPRKIRDCESKFETRNWTAGDWTTYGLITSNID